MALLSDVSPSNQQALSQQFTGPALLSYNNAPFKEEDWEGIQTTYRSIKANNPHTIGKFGIGFNSVYHITGGQLILFIRLCIHTVHTLVIVSFLS